MSNLTTVKKFIRQCWNVKNNQNLINDEHQLNQSAAIINSCCNRNLKTNKYLINAIQILNFTIANSKPTAFLTQQLFALFPGDMLTLEEQAQIEDFIVFLTLEKYAKLGLQQELNAIWQNEHHNTWKIHKNHLPSTVDLKGIANVNFTDKKDDSQNSPRLRIKNLIKKNDTTEALLQQHRAYFDESSLESNIPNQHYKQLVIKGWVQSLATKGQQNVSLNDSLSLFNTPSTNDASAQFRAEANEIAFAVQQKLQHKSAVWSGFAPTTLNSDLCSEQLLALLT